MQTNHRSRFLAFSFVILTSPVFAASGDKIPWSADQATGAPNSLKAGDQKTAWASLQENKGSEWIKLEYQTPKEVQAVRIHENFNPGAISKVTAFDADGKEVLVWEGTEPVHKAPNIFEVKAQSKIVSQSIKIYLDTKRIRGWNEIDAVQLLGGDGSKQWAVKASASSTYASRSSRSGNMELTLKSLPPSVINTVPQAGSAEVDPALKEISVTFSKDMITDRMWAVVQISKETFPKTGKNIHYKDDKRTCVIPVTLEPDKTYVMWFNKGRYNSFRDTENNPSVPYLLVFKTKSK
ncbi:MAG: Ig-like domain-containing protein [Planctomycetes bacterium]|nr:Ig-like domain-containing protein [Planctomycetota bacterium]MCH9724218.1 Ig-like domain-containing protein [Planctomycetota bacterium]MCH9778929.1 Ig-like domain-containing protein [Planctomycetota bacterium]MCH9793547.1 Ig-like domain-containing protein [Planctomycetota bacterium]